MRFAIPAFVLLGALTHTVAAAQDDAPLRVVVQSGPALASDAPNVRQAMPHLTRGADGTLLMSWVETNDKRHASLVFARLEDGETWSTPRAIASGDDWFVNWADFPSITEHADGTLVAHWLAMLGEGTYAYGVHFALSHDGGDTWTKPRLLHTNAAPVEHGFASIVALASGFGAIWLDGRGTEVDPADKKAKRGPMQILYRTLSTSGDLGEEVVLDESCCDCCPTSVALAAGGELVAIYRDRTRDEVRDISFVRRAGRDAAAWTKPEPLGSEGWVTPGCPVNGPCVVADEDVTAAAWFTGAGGGASRVRVAFRESSAEFGTPRDIDDGAPAGRVDLAFHAGELYAAWLEVDGGETTWRVRILTAQGPPSASVVIGHVPLGRASGHLRLASDSNGVVAAWSDVDSGRIRTARFVRTE